MENEIESQEQNLESSTTEQPSPDPAPQEVELDKLEKFRWNGQDLTPKDLNAMVLRQADYTRKTQALSEERKFYDNLSYDLDKVKANPALASQFKQVYPQKFHNYLRYVMAEQAQSAGQNKPSVDPEFLNRFERLEADMQERKIAAIESDLDAKFTTFKQKYPFANEEAVIARADAALDKGIQLTNEVWDKLWKSVDEHNQGIFKKHYSQLVSNQRSANSRGRDVGTGGGTPGTAPKGPKTIKEASALALRDLEQAG